MQLICPCCHTRFPLDAANQDEAARDLLALRGQLPPRVWAPLIAYLGLFRSETRALAWDRALRLAREIMGLQADPERLETALAETVEALRFKGGPPLKNHNYLKRVLESASTLPAPVRREAAEKPQAAASKRLQALEALGAWAGSEDWLRAEISAGLQALVAQSLKGQPAAEMIAYNADVWHVALRSKLTVAEVDAPRIRAGFEKLFREVTEWPTPKQLIALMPARPPRVSLPEPKMTDEQWEKGRSAARNILDSLK